MIDKFLKDFMLKGIPFSYNQEKLEFSISNEWRDSVISSIIENNFKQLNSLCYIHRLTGKILKISPQNSDENFILFFN